LSKQLKYDNDVIFFMPHKPDETLCNYDNLLNYYNNKVDTLITPLTSPWISLIKEVKNFNFFEKIQIEIEKQKVYLSKLFFSIKKFKKRFILVCMLHLKLISIQQNWRI